MVLRIYFVFIVTAFIISVLEICFTIENELRHNKNMEKVLNVIDSILAKYVIIFLIYNIFMFFYGIINQAFSFLALPILFLAFILFSFLFDKYECFNFVTGTLSVISLIFCLVMCFAGFFVPFGKTNFDEKESYLKTINILEFKQVPYTNVAASKSNVKGVVHFYIKSTPENAYYYEIATKNGGTTTKVIDGSSNYVEKYESDDYINNPHIDVYKVEKFESAKNWYGFIIENNYNYYNYYNYYIFIPQKSVFYEN